MASDGHGGLWQPYWEGSPRASWVTSGPPVAHRYATEVGVFPATIDVGPFKHGARELPDAADRSASPAVRRMILVVDRLDYSKGVSERIAAFERMLER